MYTIIDIFYKIKCLLMFTVKSEYIFTGTLFGHKNVEIP